MDFIRIHDVKNYLTKKGGIGAPIPEMVGAFGAEADDVRRLLTCLLDVGDIKKIRNTYYIAGCEIVPPKERRAPKPQTATGPTNFIETVDVSQCKTSRQKIDALLNSPEPLKKSYKFTLSERINDQKCSKMLYDFMHSGSKVSEITVMYDARRQRNIATRKNKVTNNRISISRFSEREWHITKTDYLCPERPEVISLASWEDLEKCLRTLFKR